MMLLSKAASTHFPLPGKVVRYCNARARIVKEEGDDSCSRWKGFQSRGGQRLALELFEKLVYTLRRHFVTQDLCVS